MTLGELALFINVEFGFGADLTIVPMRGWKRAQWFDQTGRVWVPSSPGIPRLETAVVYPGTCMLEGTNLSEGRGTYLPFELAGAPWVDGHRLAERLNQRGIAGMTARSASFIPTASKYQGEICQGVQIHVLDRAVFRSIQAVLEIITCCQELFPNDFKFLPPANQADPRPHFDLLSGSDKLRQAIEAGQSVEQNTTGWQPGLEEFAQRRKPYLRYD